MFNALSLFRSFSSLRSLHSLLALLLLCLCQTPLWAATLAAPTNLRPASGSVLNATNVTISWDSVPGATRYWVVVTTDPLSLEGDESFPPDNIGACFGGCWVSFRTTDLSRTLSNIPGNDFPLYWKVRAEFANGPDPEPSAFATSRFFSITPRAIARDNRLATRRPDHTHTAPELGRNVAVCQFVPGADQRQRQF